jgi:hypothetical protein
MILIPTDMDLLVSGKAGCDPETDTGMGLLYLKNELKRMFLRVLYGIQYGTARSRMKDCSNNVRCITSTWFKRYWALICLGSREPLMAGLSEMHAASLIQQDESQLSAEFIVLTDAGKDVIELHLDPDSKGKRYY